MIPEEGLEDSGLPARIDWHYMLRLSKKILYAIEALLDIAYHSNGQPVQSTEITSRQGISGRYLEQALQNLVKANILKGVRGPKGGYCLARERRLITLGEIVRIIQGNDEPDLMEADKSPSLLSAEVIQPMWNEFHSLVMDNLDNITINDLCNQARERGITRKISKNLDFSI